MPPFSFRKYIWIIFLCLISCSGAGGVVGEQKENDPIHKTSPDHFNSDFSGEYCVFGFGGPHPVDMSIALVDNVYQVSIPINIETPSSSTVKGVFRGSSAIETEEQNLLNITGQVYNSNSEAIQRMRVEVDFNKSSSSVNAAWVLSDINITGNLVGDYFPCSQSPSFDVSAEVLPHFVNSNYIELADINKVSVFRSGIGHSYTDDFETCRSMKHYFQQYHDNLSIPVYSPVRGRIVSVQPEKTFGVQIWIQSLDEPAFFFGIFHLRSDNFYVGQSVDEGEQIGLHFGDQTSSDIAIGVKDPQGWRLVSYFDVMSDALFQKFQDRGVWSRKEMIIIAAQRDAQPLSCDGETFLGTDPIPNTLIDLSSVSLDFEIQ